MEQIILFLRGKNIQYSQFEDILRLTRCPFCQKGLAILDALEFNCPDCSPKPLLHSEFMKELGVSANSDPNDFGRLMEKYADEAFKEELVTGITTGYRDFDDLLGGGLKAERLYLLAAETGMGKSMFTVNILSNIITNTNHNCSYFDLENGRNMTFARFAYVIAEKTPTFFKDVTNKEEFIAVAKFLSNRLVYRDHEYLETLLDGYAGEKLAQQISDLITKDVEEHQTKIVVIDPLENFELGDTEYNSISKVVILLKSLAQKLGISIILLHHIRKPSTSNTSVVESIESIPTPKYRIPTIYDILGTSKITNMATDVWVMVRQINSDSDFEKGKTLVRVLKNRGKAQLGDIKFFMDVNTLKFREYKQIETKRKEAGPTAPPYYAR